MVENVWITVNRNCNLRCKWCYAKSTDYNKEDIMSLNLAKELIDFSKAINAKSITLIGGEPTIYPHIFELIKYVKISGLRSTLVTNGYLLSDNNYLNKLKNIGLDMVGFSIKAANRQQQIDLTGVDCFEKIKKAMHNLSNSKGIKYAYSTVISKDTIDNIEEFAEMVSQNSPQKGLNFSFCNPYFENGVKDECVMTREEIVKNTTKKFHLVSKILKNKAILQQSVPECFWPEDFLDSLRSKKQLSFGCHVMRRNGLIFDTKGKVLVCNNLPYYPIAIYSKDFKDKDSFEKFWKSNEIIKLYDKIYEYPDIKCQTCKKYSKCAGGCAIKWFSYKGLPQIEENFYVKA